jgi:hypothetical protein
MPLKEIYSLNVVVAWELHDGTKKYLKILWTCETIFLEVLRSRIIFMWLQLRIKILMRLRLLPYDIAGQLFLKAMKLKLGHELV